MSGPGTPQLTIVTDEAGTRTWFAWLGTATDHLNAADPTPLAADTIVITLGKHGAFARTATGTVAASAPSMAIRHTHGAGAAFSGGLAHAHLRGAGRAEALHTACAIATAHCAAVRHIPQQRTHIGLIKENLP